MRQLHIKLLLVLLTGIAGSTVLVAAPDDGDNLYFFVKDMEKPTVYSLDTFDKITFTATGVKVWGTSTSREYTFDDFRLITFSPENTPTAIEAVDDLDVGTRRAALSGSQTGIFDVQGRKLNALQRGVNIIRMADGTVKKVIIK